MWSWRSPAEDLAEAAQLADVVERKPTMSRKLTAASRRRTSSASGAAEHRFVLRGAKGGDVALAAPTAADKAEWVAALRRQAARFVQRIAERGAGCCPWYHVPFDDDGEAVAGRV